MKVHITFDYPLEEMDLDNPWQRAKLYALCTQIPDRIILQLQRAKHFPNCICTAPESADQIRNMEGSVVGTIKLEEET